MPFIKPNKGNNDFFLEVKGKKIVFKKQIVNTIIAHGVGTQNICPIIFPDTPIINNIALRITNRFGIEKYLFSFLNI